MYNFCVLGTGIFQRYMSTIEATFFYLFPANEGQIQEVMKCLLCVCTSVTFLYKPLISHSSIQYLCRECSIVHAGLAEQLKGMILISRTVCGYQNISVKNLWLHFEKQNGCYKLFKNHKNALKIKIL